MFFGDKERFAIEIEINNYFYDDFVGEGKFLAYIHGYCYGLHEDYSTVFLCIRDLLKKFYFEEVNTDKIFLNFSSTEIAYSYYLPIYSDISFNDIDKQLLKASENLEVWTPESAFDDGSYMIHFDTNNRTRIIGFKSYIENETCNIKKESINEIIISRPEFKNILLTAYNYLNSQKK